ncbi:MAG TPA: Asp-tRNA(Asn)/Glu-tRNA(Gln) amidotransferase subunit GatC [Kofleriaceae bacterium]|nr:Asp-tRNA(Asn)/Glu-tRNA(Gln) amidotransferase subunit GatC [Kofleriaceae bacterium]
MSRLRRTDVEEIALLARLELDEGEVEALVGELSAILDHVEALQAVDTSGVEPMTHAVPMALRLRPDEVEPSLAQEVALGQAPARDGELFEVPAIIKSGT